MDPRWTCLTVMCLAAFARAQGPASSPSQAPAESPEVPETPPPAIAPPPAPTPEFSPPAPRILPTSRGPCSLPPSPSPSPPEADPPFFSPPAPPEASPPEALSSAPDPFDDYPGFEDSEPISPALSPVVWSFLSSGAEVVRNPSTRMGWILASGVLSLFYVF